jgi:Ser/Thr protein kinase RdoA (MazF antagonist)
MTAEYGSQVVVELEARVRRDFGRWGLGPQTSIMLLNLSENATFGLTDPHGPDLVLRVHRVGYSSQAEIRSELDWIDALRRDGIVETAAPVAAADGERVQVLEPVSSGPPRFAVAFERVPGREPSGTEAVRWFERLGELTARLHTHSRGWLRPVGFTRKRWDFDAMVGPRGFWGPWRAAIGLDASGTVILERVLGVLDRRLRRFGSDDAVFGLVHADLRLANLLVCEDRLRIIDFDDCGFSWFGYDFATAVSFIEHDPVVPELLDSWCVGYARVAQLDASVRAELPTFVMLRRMLLTAWLASHAEVPLARELGAGYTDGTVALADSMLCGKFLVV